jgi:hypothetical protein
MNGKIGLLCKIDFERRIVCGGVVGRIVVLALFASKPKKITTTFSFIVASRLEFGSY